MWYSARMRTRQDLEAEVVRVIKGIRSLPDDERQRRSMLLRDLAAALLDLREHFITESGDPDWRGRTWDYRAAVRELYSRAGVPAAEASALQAATRYHIGNALRERLSPEQLEDLGLGKPGPRERVKSAHEARSAAIAALKGDGDDPDALRTIAAVWALVSRLAPERVAALRERDRAAARKLLGEIAGRAVVLRDA